MERRRALEALRAGVPNRDAVAVLGSHAAWGRGPVQPADRAPCGRCPTRLHPGGMLIGGGFGTGKSHVLEHLAHVALSRGFRGLQGGDLQGDARCTTRPRSTGPPSSTPRCRADPARPSTRSPPACRTTLLVMPSCTGGRTKKTPPWTAGSRPRLFLHEYARGRRGVRRPDRAVLGRRPAAGGRPAPAAQGGGSGSHLPAGGDQGARSVAPAVPLRVPA